MERYYNDKGQVGIVLTNMSDLTWSSGYSGKQLELGQSLLFDPTLVRMVLDLADYKEIEIYCIEKYGECPVGSFDLRVEFIPQGTNFIIMTGMGGEYLVILDQIFIS